MNRELFFDGKQIELVRPLVLGTGGGANDSAVCPAQNITIFAREALSVIRRRSFPMFTQPESSTLDEIIAKLEQSHGLRMSYADNFFFFIFFFVIFGELFSTIDGRNAAPRKPGRCSLSGATVTFI